MLNSIYHCAKIVEEEKEWNKLPSNEREIILNALSSEKWDEFESTTTPKPVDPANLSNDCLAIRNKEVQYNDIFNFKARSILSNQIVSWTFLGPQSKLGSELENKKRVSSQFELIDDGMEVTFNIPKFTIRLEDSASPKSSKEKGNKMSIVESQTESPFSMPECKEASQNLMIKALGSLMLLQGIDAVESKQVMEVMAELTIQFLNFFGGLVRRELDIPGRVGNEQANNKCCIYTSLDACFGNGVYDVVDYALETGSPLLNQWSTQFQHLIPYKPSRSAQSALNEPIPEEDLPPRQWAGYSNHVPFAKVNNPAIHSQYFAYENTGGNSRHMDTT
jgi:hypothetical protein